MTDLETRTIEELLEELKSRHDMFVAICAKPEFTGDNIDFRIVWNCGPIALRGMSEFFSRYTENLVELWARRQILLDEEGEDNGHED